MRPIKLEMQAFGSYLEKTVIDFDKLGSDSLFLINGATGSGKSMIMDAMVYGLYGKTRFTEQSAGRKNIRHSLAKDEDSTYVKFTFALGDTVYRVERTLVLPKKEKGNVTRKIKMFNVTADEEMKEQSDKKIEEMLGFNAQQFKQVILLPQGKFRELLVTQSGDREKMLKSIFKTEIFDQISNALKDEVKKLTASKKDLESRRNELLENEESADKITEKISLAAKQLENFDKEKDLLAQQRDESKKNYDAAVQLKKNIDELNKVQQEQQDKEKLAPTIAKEQELLSKAEKAAVVEAYYNNKKQLDRQSAELKDTMKKQAQELAEKEEALQTATKKSEQAQKMEQEAKALRAQETKLQQEKERLEKLLDEVKKLKKQWRLADANYGSAKADVKAFTEAVEKAEKRSQELTVEKQNAQLAAAKENELKLGIDKMNEQKKLFGEIDQLAEKLKELQENKQQKEVELESCEAAVKKLSKDLEKAQELFQQGQAGFLAKGLAEGKPCPVCGSIHHPAPAKLSDIIPDKKDIERKQKALDKSNKDCTDKKLQLNDLDKDAENIAKTLADKKGQLPAELSEDNLRANLKQAQAEYEAAKAAGEKLASMEEESKAAAEALQENQAKLNEAQESAGKLQQELEVVKSLCDDKEKEIPNGGETLDNLGDEIQKCQQQYTSLEETISKAQTAFAKATREAAEIKASLETNKKQDAALDKELAKAIKDYDAKMQECGFADAAAYLDIMENNLVNTRAAREKMAAAHEKYKADCIKLEERAATLKKAVGNQAVPAVEKLKDQAEEAEKKLQESISKAGAAKKTLSDLKDKAARLQDIETKLQTIYKEYEVAGTLADVAEGKVSDKPSFQRYVLRSLMYDVLVQANRRLLVMSRNQYELRQQTNGDGLSMEVFDNSTGSSRPVESLSGGESFLASLAMALGLADVIQSYSGGISMDAMFIDEGFGTLDPETLDIAMKALLKLRASGRMIGIISHVDVLKERIDRRIDVIKDAEKGSRVKIVC
ncbi:AAA family ATPase [Anaerovibrio sp. RM50]|uniref:SbcC/MukB-like Walker B domain-containing protein n=1 Tax=Anaerovibrio sp. RM50 TaxID=1200557 RepID=UPI000482155B|nr:SMC family ATPase [Anaerovibrio sp. RM50]